MLKCFSDDGFEDAARRHERPLKVAVLEGAARAMRDHIDQIAELLQHASHG